MKPALLLLVLPLTLLGATLGAWGEDAFARKRPGSVGAEACAQCHADVYGAWTRASHATTLEEAGAWNLPEAALQSGSVDHAPGQTTFHVVTAEDGSARFEAETLGADGTPGRFPLTHVVGKRRIRMYVATMPDGRLQVLPGMLEEDTGEWFDYTNLIFGGPDADPEHAPVVKPGDLSFWTGPVRAFDVRCSGCHVSARDVEVFDDATRRPGITWRTMGVDCEMCHGDGATHAAFHAPGPKASRGDEPMLSLAGLPRDAMLGVCLRCHMEGEWVRGGFEQGDDLFEYLDPTLLDDAARVDPFGRPLELIYDGLPFLSSRCADAAQMKCTQCHDPHGSDHPAQLRHPRESSALCASCHAEHAADPSAHSHHPADGPGGRCTDCHMPYLTIERGHGKVSDHTISIPRPHAQSDRVAEDACTWCHQGGRGAPPGAPRLDEAGVRDGWKQYWPQAAPIAEYQAIVASARMDASASPESRSALVRLMRDGSAPRLYRATAVRLLARHGESARGALEEACAHGDSLIRREGMRSLRAFQGPEVDALLLQGLQDVSVAVQRNAAYAALAGWTRVQANAALLEAVIRALESDVDAVPDDDQRWFRLGAAYEIRGDLDGAIDAYERVVALDGLNRILPSHIRTLRQRRDAGD